MGDSRDSFSGTSLGSQFRLAPSPPQDFLRMAKKSAAASNFPECDRIGKKEKEKPLIRRFQHFSFSGIVGIGGGKKRRDFFSFFFGGGEVFCVILVG